MPKFYVVTKSNWQGDEWKPVDGPFNDKSKAQQAASAKESHPVTAYSGAVDLKAETHAKVVSKSALRHLGWNEEDTLMSIVSEI